MILRQHVSRHNVWQSITVDVCNITTHAKHRCTTRHAHHAFSEGAITVVEIDKVRRIEIVCDIDVGPTIEIDVSDCCAKTHAIIINPRRIRHVAKCPVAKVAIELVGHTVVSHLCGADITQVLHLIVALVTSLCLERWDR